MTTLRDKEEKDSLIAYQRAMSPARFERWQKVILIVTLSVVGPLIVLKSSWIAIWFTLCLGMIAFNFLPQRAPGKFVRFIAGRPPVKPVLHVTRVTPERVIEMEFCGEPYVAVQCKSLGNLREDSAQTLRSIATTFGATIQIVLTTGVPRSQWHDRPGWSKANCMIFAKRTSEDSGAALLKAVSQAELIVLDQVDTSVFDVTAGHGCWTAHYFVELMPFDLPAEFIEAIVAEPVDYTIVLSLRAQRKLDDTTIAAGVDIFLFAESKLEANHYAQILQARAREHWIKLRALRWRALPFTAAFQDAPFGYEIPFELHPTQGPIVALEANDGPRS